MKRKYYTVEIEEPTCSWEEPQRVHVHLNGHSVCFAGEQAQALIDILTGERTMMTESDMHDSLREKDEQIYILNGQIGEYKKTNARLKREKENQRDTIREYRAENENLVRKNTNQKNTISEQYEIIEVLKTQIEELTSKKNELEDMYNKQCGVVKMQRAEVDALNAMLEESKKNGKVEQAIEIMNLKEELKLYADKAKYNYERAEKAEEEIDIQKQEIEELIKENNRNRVLIDKLEDRIEDQKKTIDILQKSYAEEMAKKDKEIRHLTETHYIHFDVTNTEKIKCFVDNFKLRNENKKLKEENATLRADEFARLLWDLNRHTLFHT